MSSWPITKLPLASLTPDTAANSAAFLEGVVSLLWPYSPSSATLSLLVCEEDFRLRGSKGQLKVNFRGASARALDEKKVQIGDKVQLSLEGAELEALENATPRDVPWAIVFSTRLAMKFKNADGWDSVDVDSPDEEMGSLATAISDDADMYAPPPSAPATPPRREDVWTFKRKGDLLANSPLHLQKLFGEEEEEDIDVDLERPRKRPRFSSSFRLVDRTPSPQPEGGNAEDQPRGPSDDDKEAARLAEVSSSPLVIYRDEPTPINVESGVPADMPSSPLPVIEEQPPEEQNIEMPDSPSLRPVPSPQLPLVSPFLEARELEPQGNYLSVDNGVPGESLEVVPVSLEVQNPTPPKEISVEEAPEGNMDTGEGAPSPAPSTVEGSRPTSSAGASESEKDSLFDEMSDREDAPHQRLRSRSPLPGPSPLRKVERAKSPENMTTPTKRSKLSLHIGSIPSQPPDTPATATPATPHLYLPTPSPRIKTSENGGFPFTAPPKLDFEVRRASIASSPTETPRSQKRKLLRQSLDSAAPELSTFFARPKEYAPESNSETRTDNIADEPITPAAEEPLSNEFAPPPPRRESTQFKSGITTPLSDFPPLVFLSWGATVDVIGVVSQFSPIARAEAGQRDYYMAVRIVDSSLQSGIIMRLFRPYKEALPEVDVGDVVLLRAFKTVSQKRKLMGVSTENSAWAVWKKNGKERPAVCAGPPVEYGDEEEKYVEDIGAWYTELDEKTRAGMEGKPREELMLAPVKK